MSQKKESMFSTKVLVLIPICVGINLVGGTLAGALKLPVFLDTIGTIISAALTGPWIAAVVGLLTNIFLSIVSNPIYLPYAITSIAVGLVTGFLFRVGMMENMWKIVVSIILVSVVSAVASASVTVLFFGGATGATGTSVVTAGLIALMDNIWQGVFTSAMIENLIDRAISFAVAFAIIKVLPNRFLSQYQTKKK